jgi:cell division protein FtsL
MKYKKGNAKKRLVNMEIVRIRDNKRRELYLISGFIFTIALLLLFYVWQRLENVELAYSIEKLKKEYSKQQETNNKLKLEKERLIDLKRVSRIAKEKLGMREPRKEEIIITKPVRIKVESDDSDNFVRLNNNSANSRKRE